MLPALLLWVVLPASGNSEWTQLPDAGWSPRGGFQMVASKDRVVVAGGTAGPGYDYNDAYQLNLNDGLWYPLPFSSTQYPARSDFGMSVLTNGTIVLTGGQNQDGGHGAFNDVWALDYVGSTGGWRQLPKAPWKGRVGHAQATCRSADGAGLERLVIAGGASSRASVWISVYNDVWAMSVDGTWTQLPEAPWHKRFLHNMACLSDGRLLMTGGHSGFQDFNDVWLMSPSGDWKELTKAAPFSRRTQFGMVSFPDNSVIVGGGMSEQEFWLGEQAGADEFKWRSLGKAPFSDRYAYGLVALPPNKSVTKRVALLAGGTLLEQGIHNYNNVYKFTIDDTVQSFTV